VIFEDELGPELYKKFIEKDLMPVDQINRICMKKESLWCDNISTPDKKESFNDNIAEAFKVAVTILQGRLGDDVTSWQWGKIHTLTLQHPLGKVSVLNRAFNLNRGPFAVGGSSHTVSPYSYPMQTPFLSYHGSSHRHIFTVGDWDNSLTIIPTGQSGIPASKFYCDQTSMYLAYKYHSDPFSQGSVEKVKEYSMKFLPEK
jgi:penicillin amidase